jgi:hypothetical protein
MRSEYMRNDTATSGAIMGIFIFVIVAVAAVSFIAISSQYKAQLDNVIADPINNTGILAGGVGENVTLYNNSSTMYDDPQNISAYGQVRITTNIISDNMVVIIFLAALLALLFILVAVWAYTKGSGGL